LPDRSLSSFDQTTVDAIRRALVDQHARLGQHDRPTPERTITARNYDSHIYALGDYMEARGEPLPTRSLLERWREDMAAGYILSSRGKPLAVKSINARLSAARKMLRAVAADVIDLQVKLVLQDWANVKDARDTVIQDKVESDYGVRLTLESLEKLINSIPHEHIKGRRDRAIVALMAGAGLRVSEVVAVTMRDVFLTQNEQGQRGIHVRKGKHNKTRVVVLNSWNSWVIETVEKYTSAIGLLPTWEPDAVVVRGVEIQSRKPYSYRSLDVPLSTRNAQVAVEGYPAEYQGQMIRVNAHDLRRTFARLCKQSGMSWEALREQMGHGSVKVTEDYVGHDVDWSERVPNWTVKVLW
jgi:site-specific recombinase XerD